MSVWQVQQAKSRLSEVLDKAQSEGPQMITRHGVETAVVLSMDEYQRLSKTQPNIADVLLGGPVFPDGTFDFERNPDTGPDASGLFSEP